MSEISMTVLIYEVMGWFLFFVSLMLMKVSQKRFIKKKVRRGYLLVGLALLIISILIIFTGLFMHLGLSGVM